MIIKSFYQSFMFMSSVFKNNLIIYVYIRDFRVIIDSRVAEIRVSGEMR